MSGDIPRILIVRFSSIGDILLTTPLVRVLRARHPAARITYVVRADMADTLRHNPRLTELVPWDRSTPLSALADRLRETDWTHRLDLHGSMRSLALRQLVGGKWSGFPKHRLRRSLLIRTGRRRGGHLGHVAVRYFAAAAGLDVEPDGQGAEFFFPTQAQQRADEFLTHHGLGQARTLVAIAPGAAHATKRWPLGHWEALVRRARSTSDIVVVGGPGEESLGEALVEAGGGAVANAAGRFDLMGTAALLKRARVMAGGDTGVMHLATAIGTPVVALYGPSVEEFGYFPYQARGVVLQKDLGCRPCSSHGGPRCPLGHHRCMVDILPETVAASLVAAPR
ncbi:MAG: glycosyltransferase family 9 protein [Gemmatimonadales bacterium]